MHNLHGVVDDSIVSSTLRHTQQWYVLATPAATMPTLGEFVNMYSYERPGYSEVNAVDGTAVFRPSNSDVHFAYMFLTAARVSGPRQFPIEVDAPGYEIAIYVNKTRVMSGKETLSASPRLASGVHYVAVVLYGGEGAAQVTTDVSIPCFRNEPVPAAPQWAQDSVGNYLDAKRGLIAARLAWHNDAFAAGWNVYKAPGIALPEPTDVVFNPDGTVTVEWDGFDLDFTVDTYIYTQRFFIGKIELVEVGTEETPFTNITVEPSLEALEEAPEVEDWLDPLLEYFQEGTYSSTATIAYAGDNVITFDDTDVKLGHVYTYKLTALGFITMGVESDYSDVDWVLAADLEPPGPLTILEVKEEGSILKVIYKAPDDPDYVGVRVYGTYTTDNPIANGPDDVFDPEDRVMVKLGEPTRTDQIMIEVDTSLLVGSITQLDFYLTPYDASGNERPPIDASLVSYFGNGATNAIAVTDHYWEIAGQLEGVDFRVLKLKLAPGERTQSVYIRWRRFVFGIPADWNSYFFNITEPIIHTLKENDGVVDATFSGGLAGAVINVKQIILVPYDDVNGPSGDGNPGVMVTFTTEVIDKAEIGIQQHDEDVDLVRQDAHQRVIWDGTDFPTKAVAGDLFILRPE